MHFQPGPRARVALPAPADARLAGTAGAIAAGAGLLAALGGRSGLYAGVGLCALAVLVWVDVEALVGLWLVCALADPALPSLGGLSLSDALLILAALKLLYARPRLVRPPRAALLVFAVAWLSEAVVTVFGDTVTSQNPRFLVTLAGLTLAAYVVFASPRPAVWIRWLAIASGVAAALALAQWSCYRLTGIVLFPTAQNLFFIRTELANVFKATGLGIDPNFLGMWIVPGIGIAVVGLIRTPRRLEYGLYGALCVLGIYATGSRGSLISALIAGVLVLFIESAGPWRRLGVRLRRHLTATLVVLLLAPVAFVEVEHAIARYPVTVSTRVNQIPTVLTDALRGNWAGRGFEAETNTTQGIASPFLAQENVVHNTLLQALFEAGWLGFLVPALMLLGGLRVALRMLRGRSHAEAMLGGAFIALAINLQALGGYAFRPLWFVWALLLALDAAGVAMRRRARGQRPTAAWVPAG